MGCKMMQCMSMRRKSLQLITSSFCAFCEWVDFSLKCFLLNMCLKLVSMVSLCCGFEEVVSQKQTNYNCKFSSIFFGVSYESRVLSAVLLSGDDKWTSFSSRSWKYTNRWFLSLYTVWKLNVVFYQCKGFSFDKECK